VNAEVEAHFFITFKIRLSSGLDEVYFVKNPNPGLTSLSIRTVAHAPETGGSMNEDLYQSSLLS